MSLLTPIVETLTSSKSPWEVYQVMARHSAASFFLDSHHYAPPHQTYSYLAANPALEIVLRDGMITIRGEKNGTYPADTLFKVLRSILKENSISDISPYPFFTGGLVGFWSYELVALFEDIQLREKPGPDIPQLHLGLYRDLIVFDHSQGNFHLVVGRTVTDKRNTAAALNTLKKYFECPSLIPSEQFLLQRFGPEVTKEQFEKMVRRAQKYIAAGDIYQANLSQRFSFEYEQDPLRLYETLRRINPSPFASYYKCDDVSIVSSSPERLIHKRGRLCQTQPIAGTRPRHTAHQSEEELEAELLRNEKEKAEHLMLVDLERNDLGRVCEWSTVRVKEMMKIEKYSHVMHLVSHIEGVVRQDQDGFDLIRSMFPGGTITGCPKIRCMQIIDELEPVKRSIYTGSIGYIDFYGDLDLNIVIRTIVLKKNEGHLQVGAGIVHDSDPEREYEETLHKGEAMAEALAQVSLLSVP